MKKHLIFFLWLLMPLFCLAQSVEYAYDAAGNRTGRITRTILLSPPAPSPPDSLQELQVTSYELQEVASQTSLKSPEMAVADYFTETIAQVEMKIYPNPTTEKITLQISNMEALQNGLLQLYTLNGQLLQTRLLSEAEVTVSLAGLANGTYILKVFINDTVENWKIIKQ